MPYAEKRWTDACEIIQRGDEGRLFVSESRMSSSEAGLRQISLAFGAAASDIEQSTCALANATDKQLLAHVAEGKQEALGHLFDRYVRLVRSIASRILRDASEAEDLVQDLFLFIQRKCSIFDSSKSPARSWIVQMAYQRAIERRRYLTARQFYSRTEIGTDANQVVGAPTRESDYSVEAVFGRNGLEQVFEALSEDQRETLRMYFFEGYTLAEISKKVGQPLGNVRNHYYRGLAKLRRYMFRNNVTMGKKS